MIPWAKPVYWGEEKAFVIEALESTWISGGPFLDRVEKQFREATGQAHALAVSNGTAALHLAYLALGIAPGDEIIVPGFGFLAAANLALQFRARPVFAEVDPETWCVTAETIASCLTPRTRLIVVVHTYGNVCDMDPILDLAQKRGLIVLEDTAEALGSTYRGRWAGALSNIGTYSFQATKTLTCGEGGMVVTNDDSLAEAMFLYRSHGLYRKKHYWHEVPGNNFRLTNLQAAMVVAQMECFPRIFTARERMDAAYRRALKGAVGLHFQRYSPQVKPMLWAFAVRLDESAYPQGRDQVMLSLAAQGIETRPGFVCPDLMPHLYPAQDQPVSRRLSEWVLSLPSFPTLTEDEIQFISLQLLKLRQTP